MRPRSAAASRRGPADSIARLRSAAKSAGTSIPSCICCACWWHPPILAGTGWLLASDLFAFSREIPPTQEIYVEVTAEDDMSSIADKLKDAGLIKYKWFFRLFAGLTGAKEEIGIGTYTLNTDMDYHGPDQRHAQLLRQPDR